MAKKETSLPESVKLTSPYAFYDEDGKLHTWHAGYVVTDPEEIKTLIERSAPVEY